jgi:hypothetical protein
VFRTLQTWPTPQLAFVMHCTQPTALQTPSPGMCVQSALVAQATHVPAEQREVLAAGHIVFTTHWQASFTIPLQLESSPRTVHESAASGPMEPEQAARKLLELLGPAMHSA